MEKESQIPFTELSEVKTSGDYFKLRELRDNPKFVVKQLDITDFPEREENDYVGQKIQNLTNTIQQSHAAKFIPRGQVITSLDEQGKPALFVVAEKINGVELQLDNRNRTKVSKKDKDQLIGILHSFVDLYQKTYNGSRGQTLEFDGLHNYLRGSNAARPDGEKLYFIDLYPVFDETVEEFSKRIINFAYRTSIDYNVVRAILDSLRDKYSRKAA